MGNNNLPRHFAAMSGTRFISILSGKGGVGKSVLAFNLADQLATTDAKVLLVDADFSCGNQHVLANVAAEFGIGEYVSRQLSLKEAVLTLSSGVDLLAATWHSSLAEDRNVTFTARLMAQLREETTGYNIVIFDHSSGRSNQAAMMAHASDLTLLVAIPELTSLADCYGLYKHLQSLGSSVDCRLLINRVQSDEEAGYISTKFAALTERFLQSPAGFLAAIPEDETIRHSVAAQSPVSRIDSQAPSCQALKELAAVLLGHPESQFHPENNIQITIKKGSATADTRG